MASHPFGVLVVDDDILSTRILRRLVSSLGFAVDVAVDGQAALAYLRANAARTGLILLDLRMPKLSGFQFRAVQHQEPGISHIPVVVLSAGVDLVDIEPLGVAAVMSKPVALGELSALVRSLMPPL